VLRGDHIFFRIILICSVLLAGSCREASESERAVTIESQIQLAIQKAFDELVQKRGFQEVLQQTMMQVMRENTLLQ
jgi:hypothetical protein